MGPHTVSTVGCDDSSPVAIVSYAISSLVTQSSSVCCVSINYVSSLCLHGLCATAPRNIAVITP